MKRRDFFKVGVAGAATLAASSLSAKPAQIAQTPCKDGREFKIFFRHTILHTGKKIRFWMPLPLNSDYQSQVSNFKVKTNATNYFISDLEIPTIYAEFAENEPSPYFDLTLKIKTKDRSTDFSKFNPQAKFSYEALDALKGNNFIELSPEVKAKAKEIVRGIDDNNELEKARAIYSWVADNMQRDESVIGCGVGDAATIIKSGKLKGKCTDIGSVFVALCRAVNVPAREVFGIRVGKSSISSAIGKADEEGYAEITGAQHCRVEFYARGIGWVPADPADVTKVRLAEKLDNNSEKIKKLKEYLFGSWEGCWIAYNYGRDFDLKPESALKPINNFSYPYAEIDDEVVNYYVAKRFRYEYISQEIF